MFRYKIQLEWNGNPVLEGACTSAMAYEIVLGFSKSFSNPEKAGFVVPSLHNLVGTGAGIVFSGTGSDGTGKAYYRLECLTNP